MTDENMIDINNGVTAVNNDGGVYDETPLDLSANDIGEFTSTVATIDEGQAAADKAAVEASGLHHLQKIVNNEIEEVLKAIAKKVAQAIGETEKATHYTYAETKILWDKFKAEI